MPYRFLLLIPLLAVSTGTLAVADHGDQYSFSHFDRDGDGRITLAEARQSPWLIRSFRDADLNRDGMIDRAEFAREIAFVAVRPSRG